MRYILSMVLVLALAFPAYAAFSGPGTSTEINTVAKAKNAADDALCMIVGNVIMRVTGSGDKYIFQDSTGQITVEIDDKVFAGRDINPNTKIRISGEIDKDFLVGPTEIDVKSFEIVQ